LVIITSDHGEGLGEHALYMHGESLYRTEIRVPLLILLPSHRPPMAVVRETVSLRDLPATVVDVLGLGAGSPFPGRSLARFWAPGLSPVGPGEGDVVFSELGSPNPADPNHGRSPVYRGPLVSLAADEFVYIRNEGDGNEELFDERSDADELNNLANVDAMLPVVRRFRDQLTRVKAGGPAGIGARTVAESLSRRTPP
jgi:arylsulfatase A-like enzyme